MQPSLPWSTRPGSIVWPPGSEAYGGAADWVADSVPTPGVTRLTWQATGEGGRTRPRKATAGSTDGNALPGKLPEDKWTVPSRRANSTEEAAEPDRRRLRRLNRGRHRAHRNRSAATALCVRATRSQGTVARIGGPWQGKLDRTEPARTGVKRRARCGSGRHARGGSVDALPQVTVGTRVGCAIVEHGQLVEGADGGAGEFSYQQYIGPTATPT